jgi:hypothetical protein
MLWHPWTGGVCGQPCLRGVEVPGAQSSVVREWDREGHLVRLCQERLWEAARLGLVGWKTGWRGACWAPSTRVLEATGRGCVCPSAYLFLQWGATFPLRPTHFSPVEGAESDLSIICHSDETTDARHSGEHFHISLWKDGKEHVHFVDSFPASTSPSPCQPKSSLCPHTCPSRQRITPSEKVGPVLQKDKDCETHAWPPKNC